MKISYNWLKQFLNIDLEPSTMDEILTGTGLEVESIEQYQSVKGGLKGVVIGEVKTKIKHPDADKLSVTTVDVASGTLLNIVCGAPNVEAGQKVAVATIGTMIYSDKGDFEIKKSKIRGVLSEGMICAEDELGLGVSHDGIMVLNPDAKIGTPAKDYFKIEDDVVFTIGLTPNRTDAMSHIGVARDLYAAIKQDHSLANSNPNIKLNYPSVDSFKIDNTERPIPVVVEDTDACPRYSGITISGIEVKDSPEWLQNRLKAIGLRPINNIVDITNYLLHETGQPLHAFDADEIKGNKVIVRKSVKGEKIITLDEVERELTGVELMICNANDSMCIGGVFGGISSGVSSKTKNIFLESACFSPVSIRQTSKQHGLHTDASFRFERGTDPNQTVYVLKRAAMLIKEIAGGVISSDVMDIYPSPVPNKEITVSFKHIDRLIGATIDIASIKNILETLEIKIISENDEQLVVSIPTFKTDVTREADVIEEILRIYGYNNIPMDDTLNISLIYQSGVDKEKIQNLVADLLSNNGFYEIMNNSLTKSEYAEKLRFLNADNNVKMLNPLSSDLNVMRQSMLFGGLETVLYNQNRKNPDLKLYEFGKTYHVVDDSRIAKELGLLDSLEYSEKSHLALFISGRKENESWNTDDKKVDFFEIKNYISKILNRLNIQCAFEPIDSTADSLFSGGLSAKTNNKIIVEFGKVNKTVLKLFDVKQDVFYACFDWEAVCKEMNNKKTTYTEVPKYPEVRRDLAMLVSKDLQYKDIEAIAYQTEKRLLKSVNLFDIYEGDKIEQGKKSYAVSFTFQDMNKTLTDQEIDKMMEKLTKNYLEKLGAVVR